MVSTGLMIGLVVTYAVIALTSVLEGNYPRMMYFISAGLISISVIWMGK